VEVYPFIATNIQCPRAQKQLAAPIFYEDVGPLAL
jgi:hypothetical protein